MIAAALALVGFSYHPEHNQCTPHRTRRPALGGPSVGECVRRHHRGAQGVLIDASILPGFGTSDGGWLVGLLTYAAASGECEVVALISTEEGRGIGRGLMDAARDYAEAAGHRRLWLITTNDNTRAIRFYQGWGMDLCAFYRYGVRRSRKVKPSIPERGVDGIPLEHELEFEMLLGGTVRPEVSLWYGRPIS
jgi:GNAT superfamily N-acetyltransferase